MFMRSFRNHLLCLLGAALATGGSLWGQNPAPAVNTTGLEEGPQDHGILLLKISDWPVSGLIPLPTPSRHITGVRVVGLQPATPPARWNFNPDATRLDLELPPRAGTPLPDLVELETAEKTTQFADGRITFPAGDAKTIGGSARLESHPGNQRIGFWTRLEDSVVWNYNPTRWGMYDVECTYSAADGPGTEIEVTVAGQSFKAIRPVTGSWYKYQSMTLGRVYIAKSAPFQVQVRGVSKTGAAVMNLKAITLRPAPEGAPIIQEPGGLLTLHSRDAITRSVLMRYEPQTNKNCLGYWANVRDQAQWQFQVVAAGSYEVEVWQGCGKGHGGSDVDVEVGGATFRFVVDDTGHFQNFIPRRVGRVTLKKGQQDLWVRPARKQAGAVMDIHKILLIPTDN